MLKILVSTFLLTIPQVSLAHQDFSVFGQFGNVHVSVTTGYSYEQIGVAMLIGEMAKELSEIQNYRDPIFLDFHHFYIENIEPDYFINYSKEVLHDHWHKPLDKVYRNKKTLVIKQVSHLFDIEATLKLIEYGIQERAIIEKGQQEISYKQNYSNWPMLTIDTLQIKSYLQQAPMDLVQGLLTNQAFLYLLEKNNGLSCYYQNKQFNFCLEKEGSNEEKVIFSTRQLFQVSVLNKNEVLIFDSDSTFYYINPSITDRVVGERNLIINREPPFQPLEVRVLDDNRIALEAETAPNQEAIEQYGVVIFKRFIIYDPSIDLIVQDEVKSIGK
ncbi:MAG: hypothetical protein AAF242_06380 [Bacteroidota bacterium]